MLSPCGSGLQSPHASWPWQFSTARFTFLCFVHYHAGLSKKYTIILYLCPWGLRIVNNLPQICGPWKKSSLSSKVNFKIFSFESVGVVDISWHFLPMRIFVTNEDHSLVTTQNGKGTWMMSPEYFHLTEQKLWLGSPAHAKVGFQGLYVSPLWFCQVRHCYVSLTGTEEARSLTGRWHTQSNFIAHYK